jgi:hypothetical protein
MIGKIIFSVLLLSTVLSHARTAKNEFRYLKTITAPDSLTNEFGAVLLDSDIYNNSTAEFSNIRLLNEKKLEVPYQLRILSLNSTDTVKKSCELISKQVKSVAGNKTAIIYKRSESSPKPTELIVETPLTNFEKSISIYGSNDTNSWVTLALNKPIFDYSQLIDIRNTNVSFPHSSIFTYYKLVINNVNELKYSTLSRVVFESNKNTQTKKLTEFIQQQELFRLDGVVFFCYTTIEGDATPRKQSYPLSIQKIETDSLSKISRLYLLSSNEPIHRISLSTSDMNFSRRITIEGTNDSVKLPQWRYLTSADICNINIAEFNRKNLDISLGRAYRFRRYRLSIENNDNQPLHITSAVATGIIHEMLFLQSGIKSLALYYGADSVKPPIYDLSNILDQAKTVRSTPWKCGPQTATRYALSNPAKPIDYTKYFLTGSLFIMAIVLIGILITTVRKFESSDKFRNS